MKDNHEEILTRFIVSDYISLYIPGSDTIV